MENAHGVKSWKLYDTENALVVHLQLEPGESLKPHITPVDVFFYVLEGTGVVLVGKEKLEVSEGTLVESPKDIVHCWYNESNKPLRILVNKVPKPVDSTKLL
ncbi:MAG: cupin domain-containing protein [Spirochaetaceae bacterium]|nr:cupin domain-containing protein [Spirochaetaceae bacterium]